jgi:hypothetical protein
LLVSGGVPRIGFETTIARSTTQSRRSRKKEQLFFESLPALGMKPLVADLQRRKLMVIDPWPALTTPGAAFLGLPRGLTTSLANNHRRQRARHHRPEHLNVEVREELLSALRSQSGCSSFGPMSSPSKFKPEHTDDLLAGDQCLCPHGSAMTVA